MNHLSSLCICIYSSLGPFFVRRPFKILSPSLRELHSVPPAIVSPESHQNLLLISTMTWFPLTDQVSCRFLVAPALVTIILLSNIYEALPTFRLQGQTTSVFQRLAYSLMVASSIHVAINDGIFYMWLNSINLYEWAIFPLFPHQLMDPEFVST